MMKYIEYEDGMVVDEFRAAEIWRYARSLWVQMALEAKLPRIVMCRLRLQAVGQAEPGLCGPGQAGPYFRPHVAFGPASYDRKPEPAAQAAALKYKIFQFFKDAIWVLSALVMLSIVARYLLAYWRQRGACGPHPVT